MGTNAMGEVMESERRFVARRRFEALEERLLDYYGLSATSRSVRLEHPNLRVHLLEAGRGEPLIILPGDDGQAVDWAPLMVELKSRFRIFAVDRPGFGLSQPFDYRRVNLREHAAQLGASLLDALELDSASFMGASMGAFFGLSMALARPERVRRLILIGYPLGISPIAPLSFRLASAIPGGAERWMKRLLRRGAEAHKRQYRTIYQVDVGSIPDLYFRVQHAGLAMPGAAETWALLMRRCTALGGVRREMRLGNELDSLTPPTWVLMGDRDVAPMEVVREATRTIPNGRFVPLPRLSRFPFLEAPDRCARAIRELLAEEESGVGVGGVARPLA